MIKKTFKRYLYSYGVINKIENELILARIYNMKDDEFIDEVEFNINEFPKEQIQFAVENVIFYFSVGEIRGKPYSNFRIRKINIDL